MTITNEEIKKHMYKPPRKQKKLTLEQRAYIVMNAKLAKITNQ
jgi:hypothetical protein